MLYPKNLLVGQPSVALSTLLLLQEGSINIELTLLDGLNPEFHYKKLSFGNTRNHCKRALGEEQRVDNVVAFDELYRGRRDH